MSRPNSGRPRTRTDRPLAAGGRPAPACGGGTRPAPGARAAPRPTLVVGVTGASGAPYAVRLVEVAVRAGRDVLLIVTAAGRLVLREEAGLAGPADAPRVADLWPEDVRRHVTYVPAEAVASPAASGSFPAQAAVVVPCSMNTLAALASGRAANLVQRAAAVALKEGRPLVVVPREMPLTRIDLENLLRLSSAGAVVMPAMPGFYHRPRRLEDLVDFVVAKVLGRLGVAHGLDVRWPPGEPRA